MTVRLEIKVEYAVYSTAQVTGWPADYRRIVRNGICTEIDVDGQVFNPGEAVVVIEETVDLKQHAVCMTPRPRIVEAPEAPSNG